MYTVEVSQDDSGVGTICEQNLVGVFCVVRVAKDNDGAFEGC